MGKESKIKILAITLITAILMGISSITIYSNVCAPKFYDYFIDTGVKYLLDGNYEEAILAFNKAIEIEEKSTEARVYLAEGYVGNNEYDKAIEVLKEAQNLDITNEELLKDIINVLNEIDTDMSYEFLDRFINEVGKNNISEDINKMFNSALEKTSIPMVDPAPGIYIKPISVKLNDIKIGHSFYYTTDGSEPSKSSKKYRGKIDIDKNTTIKLIGYNKKEESTQVFTLAYIIDSSIVENITTTLEKSKNLLNNTKVGTNIGNTTEQSKKAFKLVIDKVNNALEKDNLNYNDANSMKIEIENALKTFEDNIIKPTDKSKLQSAIDKAQNLYDNSKEGTKEGEYKVGSKKILLDAINEAKAVYEDILSNQEKIDKQVDLLNNQVEIFKNKINSSVEKKIVGKFAIAQDGGIYEFRKDSIILGYVESEYYYKQIVSKREEGNKIFYTIREDVSDLGEEPVYKNSTIEIELINNDTIRYSTKYGSSIYKLLNKSQILKYTNVGYHIP